MNKLLILGLVCILLACGVLYFYNPSATYTFETIKPQIICYGGGC